MTHTWHQPDAQNGFLQDHVAVLLRSFTHWTGRALVDPTLSPDEQARQLWHAPFVVLSHTAAPDPIFDYGNRTALNLFEFSWEELIALPSRLSAEPLKRDERAHLLATVARQGFIDAYRGVRIARSGRRFVIEQATVWNLIDEHNHYCGQAATFGQWTLL